MGDENSFDNNKNWAKQRADNGEREPTLDRLIEKKRRAGDAGKKIEEANRVTMWVSMQPPDWRPPSGP